jgi:hypothetical protein
VRGLPCPRYFRWTGRIRVRREFSGEALADGAL